MIEIISPPPTFLPKAIACGLLAIGLGWTFAEVRRFFFEPVAFLNEAEDRNERGQTISLMCGVGFFFVGTFVAFHAFGLGTPALSFTYPYVAAGPETQHFFSVFGLSLVLWGVISVGSALFFPPPLFPESVRTMFCRIVRGILFGILAVAVMSSIRRIGNNWLFDGAGLLSALFAFLAIYTGQLWNISNAYVPVITCEDRPFPFVAAVLTSTLGAYLLFFG